MSNQFTIEFSDLSDEMQNEIRTAIMAYEKDRLMDECERFKAVNGSQYGNLSWREVASILYGIDEFPKGVSEDFALEELLEEWTVRRINESGSISMNI